MVGAERREEAEPQRAIGAQRAQRASSKDVPSLLHDACVTEETKRTKAYDEIYSRTRRNLKSTSTSRIYSKGGRARRRFQIFRLTLRRT